MSDNDFIGAMIAIGCLTLVFAGINSCNRDVKEKEKNNQLNRRIDLVQKSYEIRAREKEKADHLEYIADHQESLSIQPTSLSRDYDKFVIDYLDLERKQVSLSCRPDYMANWDLDKLETRLECEVSHRSNVTLTGYREREAGKYTGTFMLTGIDGTGFSYSLEERK